MVLTRGVDPSTLTAMSAPVWFPVVLVWLDWPDGMRRLHSASGTLTLDGADYLGVGAFGAVNVPGEGLGLAAATATLTLTGLPQEALGDGPPAIRNRQGAIMLGALSEAGKGSLAGAPVEVFAGYMDALRFSYAREGEGFTSSLQLDLGSGPSARQAAAILHSAEDQSRRHPGDTIMRHLRTITEEASLIRR